MVLKNTKKVTEEKKKSNNVGDFAIKVLSSLVTPIIVIFLYTLNEVLFMTNYKETINYLFPTTKIDNEPQSLLSSLISPKTGNKSTTQTGFPSLNKGGQDFVEKQLPDVKALSFGSKLETYFKTYFQDGYKKTNNNFNTMFTSMFQKLNEFTVLNEEFFKSQKNPNTSGFDKIINAIMVTFEYVLIHFQLIAPYLSLFAVPFVIAYSFFKMPQNSIVALMTIIPVVILTWFVTIFGSLWFGVYCFGALFYLLYLVAFKEGRKQILKKLVNNFYLFLTIIMVLFGFSVVSNSNSVFDSNNPFYIPTQVGGYAIMIISLYLGYRGVGTNQK